MVRLLTILRFPGQDKKLLVSKNQKPPDRGRLLSLLEHL